MAAGGARFRRRTRLALDRGGRGPAQARRTRPHGRARHRPPAQDRRGEPAPLGGRRRAGPARPGATAEVHRPRDLEGLGRDHRGPLGVRHGLGRRGRGLHLDDLLEHVAGGGGRVDPEPLLQRHREVVGRLEAVGQVLGQRLPEDRQERVVLRPSGNQVEVRLLVGDLVEDRHEVVGVERPAARRQLVEHAADAEHVAPPVDLGALDLLRRHVVGGAHDVAGAGHGGGGEARHPEVHDLHLAVLLDEDVGGLDVAVDDARLVGMGETLQHLHDDRDLAVHRHGRALP